MGLLLGLGGLSNCLGFFFLESLWCGWIDGQWPPTPPLCLTFPLHHLNNPDKSTLKSICSLSAVWDSAVNSAAAWAAERNLLLTKMKDFKETKSQNWKIRWKNREILKQDSKWLNVIKMTSFYPSIKFIGIMYKYIFVSDRHLIYLFVWFGFIIEEFLEATTTGLWILSSHFLLSSLLDLSGFISAPWCP